MQIFCSFNEPMVPVFDHENVVDENLRADLAIVAHPLDAGDFVAKFFQQPRLVDLFVLKTDVYFNFHNSQIFTIDLFALHLIVEAFDVHRRRALAAAGQLAAVRALQYSNKTGFLEYKNINARTTEHSLKLTPTGSLAAPSCSTCSAQMWWCRVNCEEPAGTHWSDRWYELVQRTQPVNGPAKDNIIPFTQILHFRHL